MARRIKRVFITGGSGFIGKNLKENLRIKYKVFAPTHKELDLLNQTALKKFVIKNEIDIIIHAAIIGGQKQDFGMRSIAVDNLRVFFNIESISKYVDKVLYCGSGLEYDKSKPIIEVKENDFGDVVPPGEYGVYKHIAAKYTEVSENIYDLVIFGIFGKYENYLYKFISNAIIKNLLGLPIIIAQNVYFSYLYIEDFCKIVEFFIEKKPKFKRYNVVPSKKIDLMAISKTINKLGDNKSAVRVLEQGLNNEYTANNKRLLSEMKNFQFTSYADSIDDLYKWYKKNLKKLDLKKIKKDPHLAFIKKVGTLYK